MVTQKQIAQRVGLDVSSVNKILNRRKGPIFKKETIRKVFKVARELGYDFDRLKFQHRRHSPRKALAVPIELSIYLSEGQLFDRGSAVLSDVSLAGALLTGIVLPQHSIPLEPHTIGLRVLDGPLKDFEIVGRPVRFTREGDAINLGIEFLKTQDVKLAQLRKIV